MSVLRYIPDVLSLRLRRGPEVCGTCWSSACYLGQVMKRKGGATRTKATVNCKVEVLFDNT